MIKIATITAIILFLTLSLASAPALACNQQNKGITIVTVQTKELFTNPDDYPFPVTFQANAVGQPKSLVGVGTLTHIFPDSAFDSKILLTGSIKGDTLTLTGRVVKSDAVPEFIGTIVKLVAQTGCKQGDVTLTIITPKDSSFAGLTLVFTGKATILVK